MNKWIVFSEADKLLIQVEINWERDNLRKMNSIFRFEIDNLIIRRLSSFVQTHQSVDRGGGRPILGGNQGSISPTFYTQLFCTIVVWAAFMFLQFGFVIFWQKEISSKAASTILVKLTTGVTITSTLAQSTKELPNDVWLKRCHSLTPTKLCPTLLSVSYLA